MITCNTNFRGIISTVHALPDQILAFGKQHDGIFRHYHAAFGNFQLLKCLPSTILSRTETPSPEKAGVRKKGIYVMRTSTESLKTLFILLPGELG